MCGNEQVVIVTHQNVQFDDVRLFKETSDEEKFIQHGEMNGKSVIMSYFGMLDVGMPIIDPNWANEVCK